ncbi:uncharacterized protein BO80DRAFT_351248 [Aspergillus ibericus CBS 121593]|uniref:Uncharacterized protein n=1 Tax=Aspergillus ibericus CBS 121593 TaxID=1448316 RepID=A0A395H601_9EURO|nr:hypothetical protein BO80DRAFT_351248 [Aspergillus ibericus CBS 121593]RAL03043.1 hypothetical protein BO80DRAFT_351248 [Aspergillus ibericus CBS 121593]
MTSRFQVKFALGAVGLLGLLGTYGRGALDGSTDLLFRAVDRDTPYVFPGTLFTLRQTFTGIWFPIDYLLNVLVVFWFEAVDGSHPSAAAISLYFLGQLLPCLVLIYSTSVRGDRPTPDLGWMILPAILLGYFIPGVIMALPSSLVGNPFQQYAIAIWNLYPLLVFACETPSTAKPKTTPAPTEAIITNHLRAVRVTNTLALIIGSVIHLFILGVSLATVLFPSIFQPIYVAELSPSTLFFPPVSMPPKAVVPGDGVASLLLWDQFAGYLLVMIVTIVEVQRALMSVKASQSLWSVVVMAVVATLLLGPGSACLLGSWVRDEVLFGGWIQDSKRDTKSSTAVEKKHKS